MSDSTTLPRAPGSKSMPGGREAPAPASTTFGCHTFNLETMQRRLPRPVYEAIHATIRAGEPLDMGLADAVAGAMKDWAIEHGATHFTHWFQPLTGATAEKHDAFLSISRGLPHRELHGLAAHPGGAGRVELPVGWHAIDLRGPRLHRVGSDLSGVPRVPRDGLHADHPLGLRVVDGRSARQEDAAAPLDARDLPGRGTRPEARWASMRSASFPPSGPSRSTS